LTDKAECEPLGNLRISLPRTGASEQQHKGKRIQVHHITRVLSQFEQFACTHAGSMKLGGGMTRAWRKLVA